MLLSETGSFLLLSSKVSSKTDMVAQNNCVQTKQIIVFFPIPHSLF